MWELWRIEYKVLFEVLLAWPLIIGAGIGAMIFYVFRQPTSELKALFDQPKRWYFYPAACAALYKRHENLNFALPICIDLALSGKGMRELAGFWCLDTYFRERIPPDIIWSKLPLSTEARIELSELRESLR